MSQNTPPPSSLNAPSRSIPKPIHYHVSISQLHHALESAEIGYWEIDVKTMDSLRTLRHDQIFGYSTPQPQWGMNEFTKHVVPEHKDIVVKAFDLAVKQGKPIQLEFKFNKVDGTPSWAWVKGEFDQKKNRITGIIQDITDLKYAQYQQQEERQHLLESEARLTFMAESMPQKIFTATPDGEIDYFNPSWMMYTGLSFDEILGWGWVQFIHPDDVEENVKKWKHSIATGEMFEIEHRFRRHDGTFRWHVSRAHAMKDDDGKVIMWIGSNTDIEEIRTTVARKKELESIAADLTAEKKQLLALNKAKDEFISLASHQLRTPATGVKLYTDLLINGYAGTLTEEQLSLIQTAHDSNERQLKIIDALLKVAHLDAGKITLTKSLVNFNALMDNIIAEMKSVTDDRMQTVTYKAEKKTIEGYVDERYIRMVIENILDNASKYSKHDTSIHVTLKKSKNNIIITIQDKGVGIDKKDFSKLFRKFSRIDNPLSISVSGTGLGLYWAQKIVLLHGGSIELDSKINQGTTFTISLPLEVRT
ncbi:MAG: hypothetical protein NVSMB46_05920 [Candidatus Saccharimonadales bacterium]